MDIFLLDMGNHDDMHRQLLFKAEALQSDFFHALVVCPAGSPLAAEARERGLECAELPSEDIKLGTVYALWRLLRRHGTSVVLHAFGEKAHRLVWIMKKLCGDRVSLLLDVADLPPREPRRAFKKYLEANLLCSSTDIVTWMQNAGVPGVQTHVLPPFIQPESYQPCTPRNDGRFVYGIVAPMNGDTDKGHSIALQALTILREMDEVTPWELRIFGGGTHFSAVLEEARSLEVDYWLSMLGEQDNQTMLAQCDVLLVPSVHALSIDMGLLEGWAVGLPVVCSALPANMRWAVDKTNCLLVPPANPLALASAMLRLMRERSLAQNIGRAGHEAVMRYAATYTGMQYLQLCHRIVPSAPPLQP